ncbi:hypothetical protein F53441_6052 [Fusarium austroafricanum]|uniref:Uncharacterized protein n=1 Tax=Fusarium austroafricanum TaxID=2364996 RepID=A0A8H4KKL2_9HYPO|nr:hypothetical protein F53441_6052 [Fusarium austroafricanum]
MSILSSIKRARDHKETSKAKEPEQPESTKPIQKYRHVPTHAACDSVNVGPAGARHHKIRAENRKRTAKAVAETMHDNHAIQMNFPGSSTASPFTSGSVSTTYQASEVDYYDDGDVSPRSHSPVHSYEYSPAPIFPQPPSLKGKEVVRGPQHGLSYTVSPDPRDRLSERFQAGVMI